MENVIKDEISDSENLKIRNVVKRALDILIALIGILILIPASIIIYIAKIILKDNGTIFYSQNRIGKNGKIFKMYKYRSMVVGADEKLNEILATNEKLSEEYKACKKLKNDPRVTKIGKFIRKTNIDELPQFINVLKGDMSVVGPRPYLEREIEDMGENYKYIIKCKPGVTGLWQVNAEKQKEFIQRLELDKEYVKENNLIIDISLFFKTIFTTLRKVCKFNKYTKHYDKE